MTDVQTLKANVLHALHRGPKPLLLVNVWDVASARIVEEACFPAIATTSAGIAFSLGYADGQKISREEMVARVSRIARAVKVPVTADVEAGYGPRPEDAAQTARAVLDAGAVGMNLEDATGEAPARLADLSLQVEKIRAIREAALQAGVSLVLNARTDVYLAEVGPPETRCDGTLRRLRAYRDAGADCVFAPGLRDAETIGRLVREVQCPVNILAGPGSPSVSELQRLGVMRISLGSSAMRGTLGRLREIAAEFETGGTYRALENSPSYADMNRMLE
jgi:2-methylisocitrate lyase-like PEP mutase family enzyme